MVVLRQRIFRRLQRNKDFRYSRFYCRWYQSLSMQTSATTSCLREWIEAWFVREARHDHQSSQKPGRQNAIWHHKRAMVRRHWSRSQIQHTKLNSVASSMVGRSTPRDRKSLQRKQESNGRTPNTEHCQRSLRELPYRGKSS